MLEMLRGLEQKVDAFRKSYKCNSELSINNNETVLHLITTNAYNHDAMWRTLRKETADAHIDQNNKATVIEWLYKEIEKLFNSNINTQADFDIWHNTMCQKLTSKINAEVLFGYKPIHMGKAQKIINMSFKYLSSLDGADNYESYFNYCHIPLDDNILKWYYSNIAKNVSQNQYKNWSNLEYKDYIKIQKDFRNYCEGTEYVPLSLEWKIF